jgi:hypothetical protein
MGGLACLALPNHPQSLSIPSPAWFMHNQSVNHGRRHDDPMPDCLTDTMQIINGTCAAAFVIVIDASFVVAVQICHKTTSPHGWRMAFKADKSALLFIAIDILATKKPQSFDAVSLQLFHFISYVGKMKKTIPFFYHHSPNSTAPIFLIASYRNL